MTDNQMKRQCAARDRHGECGNGLAAAEQAVAGKTGAAPAGSQQKMLRIDGMMCHHCENAVKNALERLDFIEEASADFEAGTAVITLCGEADEEAIRKAVAEEDYEYLGMN